MLGSHELLFYVGVKLGLSQRGRTHWGEHLDL